MPVQLHPSINNVQIRQVETVGPGGQPASVYRVQHFVGDQGPFISYYTPDEFNSDAPATTLNALAASLGRFGFMFGGPHVPPPILSPSGISTQPYGGNPVPASQRIPGQTYSSSTEGWSPDPQGATQLPLLNKCWSNVQVVNVPTSLDSSTADGQQQIQQQFNIQPQGPYRYFVVVRFTGTWIGGADCVV